ncbi:unnamed protein product [Gongylonema pulchrum]|uniref:G_PROTEIN_RECEP_F1_2 domain-containing protein n=1 Tax=Gongylonema pulchrum TaxID=637853 RepID=A0A183EEE8_9BILA|nr:unnamed protein product [Gongylonema pulchrum]
MLGLITNLDISFAYAANLLFMFLFPLGILILPLGFVYRYALICGKRWLVNLYDHSRSIICICLPLIIVSLAVCVGVEDLVICKKVRLDSTFLPDTVVIILFKNKMLWLLGLICFTLCVSMAISYSIIFLTSYHILKTLRQNASAQRTKVLQRQLTVAMLVQALVPMVCTAVPLFTFCITHFAKVPVLDYGSLAMALLNWQPCLNPIISLYFVKPFWNGLLHLYNPSMTTVSTLKVLPAVSTKNAGKTKRSVVTTRCSAP